MAKATHGFSEEELAALPPAEREALEAELSPAEEHLAKGGSGVAAPGTDPLLEKKEDDEEDGESPVPEKANAAPAAAKPKADADEDGESEEGEEEGEGEEEPPARERSAVPVPAREVDMEKVKQALAQNEASAKEAIAEVEKQFKDGDIDDEERLQKRDAINDEKARRREEINRAVQESELAQRHDAQVKITRWKEEVKDFLDAHPAYKDKVLYRALNEQVKAMAEEDNDLTDRQLLAKAHEEIAKRFKGLDEPKSDDPAKVKADKLKAVKAKRAPDLSVAPPTVGSLPAAAPQNTEADDEFAHLDALMSKANAGDAASAAQLEREIAKLPPAAQDRWARAA